VGDRKRVIRTSVSRSCFIQLKGLPPSIVNIDKAVDQLKYIATEDEISYIKGAPAPDEEQRRFLEFWAKRDPDPSTVENELMDEYYSRVEYADKNFSNFGEGWRSDRGMVYIMFGRPENIDRYPFNANNKPYEIWYYYALNRQFIFVDDTGFGDYRLHYPTTDLWGRMR
jgi:GWxTD domain-containing protein